MLRTETDLAEAIARIAHRGQRRNIYERADGSTAEPYINHPLRVAKALSSREAGVMTWVYNAALLHDVIEDSLFTHGDLVALGISKETARLVEWLTRMAGETYAEFIDRISLDADATVIKIADLEDNLSTLPEGHSLRKRYVRALQKLQRRELMA